MNRYQRQTILPEIANHGQEKILAGAVFVIGSGALGGQVAHLLAGAGVGRIGIIDFDTIDESNLQRQLFFATADVGRKKAEVLASRLRALNPAVSIEMHDGRFSADNADELLQGYDFVIDASDNFSTKYMVCDICTGRGLPHCIGAVRGWEGQVTTWMPGCISYREIFPEEQGEPKVRPLLGVMGPSPAITASVQACEAIKYLAGLRENLLTDRLLVFDTLRLQSQILRLR